MPLSTEERAQRKRDRMIEKAREKRQSPAQYARNVAAPVFQKMIRAEAAAKEAGTSIAVAHGEVREVFREVGQCVCVTCGRVGPWTDKSVYGGTFDTGHFLAGRGASIVFEETGAHPQCKYCNDRLGGNQANYEIWMRHVYGQDEIDRLRRLKAKVRQFTIEEIVDMRIEFGERLKAAEERMKDR